MIQLPKGNRTAICAEEVILEQIDRTPAKGADAKTIIKLTGLSQSTVSRAIRRLMMNKKVEATVGSKGEGRDKLQTTTIIYQIPEPVNSPSVLAGQKKTEKLERELKRTHGVIMSASARVPEWGQLAMKEQVILRLQMTPEVWEEMKITDPARIKLLTAFYADEPDQIVDQIVTRLYEDGSDDNHWMKRGSDVRWSKEQIREVIEKLLDQGKLRIKRNFVLETSPELMGEFERVKESRQRIEERVMSKLIADGKLKSIAQVPSR
jgi:DNA-binding transcriptional ArsR family regulator